MKMMLPLLICGILVGCGSARKSSVRIDLPLPPKLNLVDYDQVYFPGFVSLTRNEGLDAAEEAINFFQREFNRRNIFPVAEQPQVNLDNQEPRTFFDKKQPFFANFDFKGKERTLAISGVVNYEVLDRSGFRQVQSTDFTGQRYYRTQFVEATGYLLKIRIYVYEMKSGNLVYRELVQDEIDVEGEPGDVKLAFYNLLDRVSGRVLGLFAHTNVKAERSLL